MSTRRRDSQDAIADVRAYASTMSTGEVLGALQCVSNNLAALMAKPVPPGVSALAAAEAKEAHYAWMTLVSGELCRRLEETTKIRADHSQCQQFMDALNVVTFRDILGVAWDPPQRGGDR